MNERLAATLKQAQEYAGTSDELRLSDVVADVDLCWQCLDLLAKNVSLAPFSLSENRPDVNTIASNLKRRRELKKWLKEESAETVPYFDLYKSELDLLDAYAIQAMVDIHKADNNIMIQVNNLRQSAPKRGRKKASAQ